MAADSSIDELNTLFVEKLTLIQDELVPITTIEELKDASLHLKMSSIVAFDCEGVSLSRVGPCTLMQLVGDRDQKKVFIVDLVVCTAKMLEEAGIKALLEDASLIKICWDGRMDCDALLHQFNIRVNGILDLQTLDIFYRRAEGYRPRFVNGYAFGVTTYASLSSSDNADFERLKNQMINELSCVKGVRCFEFWRNRPLSQIVLQYAANDVLHMFAIRTKLLQKIKKTEIELIRVSTLRIDQIRDSPVVIPNTREFAKVNF